MFRAFILTSFFLFIVLVPFTTNSSAQAPQVIKLERFRKALWKVNITVKGKTGDFLLNWGTLRRMARFHT